jgi:hypothetical protein
MNARRNVARAIAVAGTAAALAAGLVTSAGAVVSGNITGVSGNPALNTGTHTISVTADGPFLINGPVTFTFTRTGTSDHFTSSGTASTTTAASTAANFAMANPGLYNIEVTQGSVQNNNAVDDACNSCLTVTAFGPSTSSVSPSRLAEGTARTGFSSAGSGTPCAGQASNSCPGTQPFTISGGNFDKGPYTTCSSFPCANAPTITFLREGTTPQSVDPAVQVLPTVDANGDLAPTAPTTSTITLRVDVLPQAGDTTHVDDVVVTNSDGKSSTCAGCLTIDPQPTITKVGLESATFPGTELTHIGANATGQTVQIYGTGFPSDATVAFTRPSGDSSKTDAITYSAHSAPVADPNTVGQQIITLTGVNTTSISTSDSAAIANWGVFVSSAGEHAISPRSGLLVDLPPSANDDSYPSDNPPVADASGALGQGANGLEQVSQGGTAPGSVFTAAVGNDVGSADPTAPHTVIQFANAAMNNWILKQTDSGNGKVNAFLSVPANAAAGSAFGFIAVNPDGGTSGACNNDTTGTVLNSCGLNVDNAPKVGSVSPSSVAAGSSPTLHLGGTFNSNAGLTPNSNNTDTVTAMVISTAANGANTVIASGTGTVNNKGTAVDIPLHNGVPGNTSASGPAVPLNTPIGDYTLVVINDTDQGEATLTNGFHVVKYTVSQAGPVTLPGGLNAVTNDSNYTLQLSGTSIPQDVAQFQLTKNGVPSIAGSNVQPAANGSSITATFNLINAAPGVYDALVTSPSEGSSGCSQCFTIQALPPSLTSVSPAAIGAGAQNVPVTVVGQHFFPGSTLAFSNTHVHPVGNAVVTNNGDGTTTMQQLAAVDPGAAADNAGTVKVTNTDGQASGTKPFAVDAGPTVSDTSYPAHASGQSFPLTVNGSNFANNAVLSFSNSAISATYDRTNSSATKLVATITAPSSVTSSGPATVHLSVVNPSDGGQGPAPDLTVDPAPSITSTNPTKLVRGSSSTTLQVLGSNFTPNAVVSSPDANVVVSKSTYVSSSEVDAIVSVPSSATTGVHDLTLDNGDGGTATVPVTVIGVPSAPTNLTAVGQPGGLAVSWGAPTDNGGDPITGYTVTVTKDSDGSPAGSVTTDAQTLGHSFTGLTDGATYDVSVVAINHAGSGPAATTQGSPTAQGTLGAPRQLAASARDGKVVLSWLAPSSSGGSAIDHYTVFVSPGNRQVQTTGTSVTVTGLSNGTLYTFDVTAHNGNGNGPASGFVSARPKFVTSLSLHRSATSVRSGHRLVLSGRLLRSNGSGRGNATVRLYRKIGSGSYVRIATFKTGSSGGWSRTLHPKRTARYYVSFAGDGADRSSKSGSSRVSVH